MFLKRLVPHLAMGHPLLSFPRGYLIISSMELLYRGADAREYWHPF
jgi:hypothetical protein